MTEDAGVAGAAAVAAALAEALGLPPTAVTDRFATVTLTVAQQAWQPAAAAARGAGFEVLDWLSAVDRPAGDATLDVVAMLVRHPTDGRTMARLVLRTRPQSDTVDSLSGLWPSAAWHERETAEMFGVRFAGFTEDTPGGWVSDARPLLTAGWPQGPGVPPLRAAATLPARAAVTWPGLREPVEPPDMPTDAHRRRATGRRPLPPGVPA